MSVLELSTRVQLGAQQVDFRKAFARLGRLLITLLVFAVSVIPFCTAWLVTMVVKLSIAAAREGARSAASQLGGG